MEPDKRRVILANLYVLPYRKNIFTGHQKWQIYKILKEEALF